MYYFITSLTSFAILLFLIIIYYCVVHVFYYHCYNLLYFLQFVEKYKLVEAEKNHKVHDESFTISQFRKVFARFSKVFVFEYFSAYRRRKYSLLICTNGGIFGHQDIQIWQILSTGKNRFLYFSLESMTAVTREDFISKSRFQYFKVLISRMKYLHLLRRIHYFLLTRCKFQSLSLWILQYISAEYPFYAHSTDYNVRSLINF